MGSGGGGTGEPPVDVARLHGHTRRLVLRPYRPDDVDALAAIYATPESVRFVPFPVLEGESLARAIINRTAHAFEKENDRLSFVAQDRAGGGMVGEFALFKRGLESRTAEFGYAIHPGWSGRGLATEGSWAIMELAFQVLGVRRLTADIDPRNAASAAILAKLGMRREAHFVQSVWEKGALVDQVVYAMLAHEWPGTSGVAWRF